MNKLKVGVIGTGHLGKLHIKMFDDINNCSLIGVYDSDAESAKSAAQQYSIKSYTKLEDLLKQVDAVSIAATTSAHFELASRCLKAKKHVFIEKPITATISEAREIVELAGKMKLKIQVGHIERFNPAVLSIEKFIDDPKFIQTDRLAQFNPRGTDVAVVLDLMIHDIDIILSFVKSKVKNIEASGVAVVSDNIDIANARIQFENGAVANVTASRISQKKMRKMRIFQKDSYISLDFVTGVSEVYRLLPLDDEVMKGFISFGEIGVGDKKKRLIYEQPEHEDINALRYELQLFVSAVLEDKRPVVAGEDGLRALKIADIIIQKINESLKELK